jgi:Major Facilitator Superfamily
MPLHRSHIFLQYMSLLNLLSDWTCYSVAPIALLTEEAFGRINAEQLVTIFLVANAVASACEPMILARLGLRRTVLFGSLLLMIGNITKSGGMPPIIQTTLKKGSGEWRVYLGFFIVGLSQPLYQCTPALLSASWFPEAERTLATSVALNANQLGIGFAFIFGTLLVADSSDIPNYFSLLSVISTLAFLGTLIQFSDAPPTPPSETAKVVRGTLEVNLPNVTSLFETVCNIGQTNRNRGDMDHPKTVPLPSFDQRSVRAPAHGDSDLLQKVTVDSNRRDNGTDTEASESQIYNRKSARRRVRKDKSTDNWPKQSGGEGDDCSNTSRSGKTHFATSSISKKRNKAYPSPALAGPVGSSSPMNEEDDEDTNAFGREEIASQIPHPQYTYPNFLVSPNILYTTPDANTGHQQMQQLPFNPYQYYNPYTYANWQPNFNQYAFYYQQQALQHGYQIAAPPVADQFYQYYSYQHAIPPPPHMRGYEAPEALLPPSGLDEGVEPVLTITPHHLDINIRDDQVILSLKACMSRPGFVHSLVSFTVSGIVINTLSTFMDYLVRLNGAGREYTGIVGGSFQFVIMISSLVVGQWCDKTRAYYSITIGMLVLGAFGLAECGVSLDADRGNELRWALVIVAALVGPLQPISTELGVDVVYPLSENTVLVIQQLFSNLLSAAFIPCFKAMRDIGTGTLADGVTPKPQYTFSFYLLIVLHAICTVFFATFNGRYLRFEHEQDKLAEEEKRKAHLGARAFQPPRRNREEQSEDTPLLS